MFFFLIPLCTVRGVRRTAVSVEEVGHDDEGRSGLTVGDKEGETDDDQQLEGAVLLHDEGAPLLHNNRGLPLFKDAGGLLLLHDEGELHTEGEPLLLLLAPNG